MHCIGSVLDLEAVYTLMRSTSSVLVREPYSKKLTMSGQEAPDSTLVAVWVLRVPLVEADHVLGWGDVTGTCHGHQQYQCGQH